MLLAGRNFHLPAHADELGDGARNIIFLWQDDSYFAFDGSVLGAEAANHRVGGAPAGTKRKPHINLDQLIDSFLIFDLRNDPRDESFVFKQAITSPAKMASLGKSDKGVGD